MTNNEVLQMSKSDLKKDTEFSKKKRKLIWGKQTLECLTNILLKLVEYIKLFMKGGNKKYCLTKDK